MKAKTGTMTRNRLQQILLLAGIILVALNLRPALASVGPLVGAIRETTGFSYTALGMLTTLPLLAFGVVSTLTSLVTRRFGIEWTITGALVLITAGILGRVIPSGIPLFGGTILLGIGIALGNVLLPGIVKRDFAAKTGIMTSIYSSMLGLGAAVAAGVSVPLADGLDLGWQWAMGGWSILSLLGIMVWLPQLRYSRRTTHSQSFLQALKELTGSKVAWQVALFMGLQSLNFYVFLAWLPEILQDQGMSAARAGWMLSLSQGMGVLGTLLVPAWADRMTGQQKLVWWLVIIEIVSIVGLMVPSLFWVPLWVSVIGFSLGGSFGLSLLFIVLRSSDAETTTELSGMAQSIGYTLAATGPAVIGALHDLTRDWTIPLVLLILLCILKLMAGLGAGKPVKVEAE